METWLTSDLHGMHSNIIKYCNRPFLTEEDKRALSSNGGIWHSGNWKRNASDWKITKEATELMDSSIIASINKYVAVDDELWILGDFAMPTRSYFGEDYIKLCTQYREQINCKNVNIIWGNHDKRVIKHLFTSYHDILDTKINNQYVTFCHYAMAVWNHSHRSSIHCYGHSHGTYEEKLDLAMPGRKSMDVGIDNAYRLFKEYRPFNFKEVQKRLTSALGSSLDRTLIHEPPTREEEKNNL